jgi:hypothetical protein
MEGARVVPEVWAAQPEIRVVPALPRAERQGQAPIPGREAGGRVTPRTNKYEALLRVLCRSEKLPMPVAEYVFAPPRKWRLDLAWPDRMVALEVQGGIWTRGRHARGSGLVKEHEKLNRAAALGWRVLYCTPDQLVQMIPVLKEALKVTA